MKEIFETNDKTPHNNEQSFDKNLQKRATILACSPICIDFQNNCSNVSYNEDLQVLVFDNKNISLE